MADLIRATLDANEEIDRVADRNLSKRGLVMRGFKIGWRARQATIDRLTRERDEARDLAFRATFAPEEGAYVQYGVQDKDDGWVTWIQGYEDNAVAACNAASRCGGLAVQRTHGPWKPVKP